MIHATLKVEHHPFSTVLKEDKEVVSKAVALSQDASFPRRAVACFLSDAYPGGLQLLQGIPSAATIFIWSGSAGKQAPPSRPEIQAYLAIKKGTTGIESYEILKGTYSILYQLSLTQCRFHSQLLVLGFLALVPIWHCSLMVYCFL
jgi:hypothetical protein